MWVKSMKTLPCAFRPELMGRESARLCFPFRLCPCAKGLEDLVAGMGFRHLDLGCRSLADSHTDAVTAIIWWPLLDLNQ